jgi:hypothetical protein
MSFLLFSFFEGFFWTPPGGGPKRPFFGRFSLKTPSKLRFEGVLREIPSLGHFSCFFARFPLKTPSKLRFEGVLRGIHDFSGLKRPSFLFKKTRRENPSFLLSDGKPSQKKEEETRARARAGTQLAIWIASCVLSVCLASLLDVIRTMKSCGDALLRVPKLARRRASFYFKIKR